VILDVAPAVHAQPEDADYDCIRAKIGLEFLERQSITSIAGGKRIFFSGPKRTRYQKGIQLVFLGMVCPEQLSTAESKFSLLKVNWRRDRQF